MANNMESLLMGEDSSSGESDNEDAAPVSAPAPVPPPVPQPLAAPAPKPTPAAAPAPSGGKGSRMEELKNLYSRSKSSSGGTGTSSTPGTPAAPKPVTMPPQSQNRAATSSSQQQAAVAADPYAPTPLSQIKQNSQSRATRVPHQQPPPTIRHQPQQMRTTGSQQQQQQQQQPQMRTTGSQQPQPSTGSRISGTATTSTPLTQQDIKKQKERFLMFTKVLIKYLEQKDQRMYNDAKKIIKDCAERNKRKEPGYESVTISMKRRLKELVGEHYWKKATDYLIHFLEQKRKMRSGGGTPGADGKKGMPDKANSSAAPGPSTGKGTKSKKSASSKAGGAESKTSTKGKTTKKVVRRKSVGESTTANRKSTGSKSGPTVVTTVVKRTIIEEPPREYKELMESIDHALEYDWPSIGQLLGNKADVKLVDEERQLLYGDSPPESLLLSAKKKTSKASTKSTTEPAEVDDPNSQQQEQQDKQEEKRSPVHADSGIRPGWDSTNVLSARAAWARIRLGELRQRALEAANPSPVVAGGLLTLPTAPPYQPPKSASASPEANATMTDASSSDVAKTDAGATTEDSKLETATDATVTSSDAINAGGANPDATAAEADVTTPSPETPANPSAAAKPDGSWVNEETAEQDKALALLSEGCQLYLKGVFERAIQCARQRQNVDGIRLWHQQYAHGKGTTLTTASVFSKDSHKNKVAEKAKKPPLMLRLGCDVSRQVARAQGNAALTVKRMEEALVRQTGVPLRARQLRIDTLCEATSMGDLSWRPPLKKGAHSADLHAKRAFEIYGGKEAKDPPLGRVPKKAKLSVEDFVMGSELDTHGGQYHKAHTASSFISF
eukprot:jgi/Psemu1/326876/estExt_fgenesh1_pg.C_4840003